MAAVHPSGDPVVRLMELDYNHPVLFGKTTHEFFGFTPFSQNSFNLEDSYWLTLEHYMQAKKFCGHPSKIEEIKKIKKPEQIAHYTNDPENSRFINDAWNKNKMAFMYRSLYSKFAQNEVIHEQLMQTGNRYLIYATDDDKTWGIGIDRSGKNYLGLLLCILRTYFLSHPKPLSPTPPADCQYNFMHLPEHILTGHWRQADIGDVDIEPSSSIRTGILYFGEIGKPFYELCNDATYSIELDGKVWLTVTHYYQTQKFAGNADLQTIMATFESPNQLREFAHSKKEHVTRDFQMKKDTIMLRALTAKFTQRRDVLAILLNTLSRTLVYDCSWDSYWGIGPDNKGLNRLGNLLCNIRASMLPGGALHKPVPIVPKASPIRPTRHDDIFFFDTAKEYFEFTPYSHHRIFLDGKFWPTVGHYFQAQKFIGKPEIFAQIEACNSAYRAWEIAHDPKNVVSIPTSFEKDRDGIMDKAINAKIEQHESVMNSLRETGNRRLMFAAQDNHWGIGTDNNGNNKIGKILMEIRSRFNKKIPKATHIKAPTRTHTLTPPMVHKPTPETPRELNTIYFFQEKDPLYPLTSFSNYSFMLYDLKWPTLNHYFQAQKFKTHPDIQERIRQALNPLQALCIAQERYEYIISNWKDERVDIMQLGLEVRFEQNPSLIEMLMSTGNVNLVLNNKKDEYWAIGDGTGKNRYGKILVKIREKYAASHKPTEQLVTMYPMITQSKPAEHHVLNSEAPNYTRPISAYQNPVEIQGKPIPLPRRAKPYSSISVNDTEWTLEHLERPASYSVNKLNNVIIAKNANDEVIATICDTAIRFPMSVCDDEEYLYIVCAPTLVKVNKFSGKKVNEVCLQSGNAQVDLRDDSLRVTDEVGEKETSYTLDLVQYV